MNTPRNHREPCCGRNPCTTACFQRGFNTNRGVGAELINTRSKRNSEGNTVDITTIPCGSATRDRIADYRDANDHPNYDAALSALVEEATARDRTD